MDIQIGNPNFFFLLVFGVLAVVLAIGNALARNRAAERFASTEMRKNVLPSYSMVKNILSTLLVATSIALLAIALLDIRWGKTTREVPQKGIEVMFALDVSRSMLAEDVSPNRLRRAKQQIKDMIDEMAGDRVGLVVFAGDAVQSVPLTSHYDDFKQILDSVGPHSVPLGGSRLGVAIQAATDGFIGKTDDHKTIILFTDGEDQESEPVELAKRLHAKTGVRIFTVGLGDFEQGSRIPDSGTNQNRFVEHEGQQVWSKLNGRILRSIASETDAAYIPAGTKRVNMADVYHGYVANIQQTEFESAKIDAYTPRFQWFALAGLSFLLLEIWLSTTASRFDEIVNVKIGAAVILWWLLCPNLLFAQSNLIPEQINAANRLVREQKVSEAIDAFSQIEDTSGTYRDQLSYNLAVAHYRNDDFPAAKTMFEQSAQSVDSDIAANSRYNLGNCNYSMALQTMEQDPQTAVAGLQAAITNYRSSLRLNSDNADARANLELAQHLIRALENQQNEQQKNEQQQNKSDEQQDQNQQPQDRQNEQNQSGQGADQNDSKEQKSDDQNSDESEQSENQGTENGSPSDSTEQDQKPSSQESEQQSEPNQSESDADKNQTSQSGSADQATGSDNNADRNEQAAKGQRDPPGKSQQQADSQHETAESMRAESDQPESKQPQTGNLTSSNQNEEALNGLNSTGTIESDDLAGMLTKEEALKMLQAIRDRDMIRRLRQQQQQRSRRVRVDKDW